MKNRIEQGMNQRTRLFVAVLTLCASSALDAQSP
jgi:hypothetical protein